MSGVGSAGCVPDLHAVIVTTRDIGTCPAGTCGEVIRRNRRSVTVFALTGGIVTVPLDAWRADRVEAGEVQG